MIEEVVLSLSRTARGISSCSGSSFGGGAVDKGREGWSSGGDHRKKKAAARHPNWNWNQWSDRLSSGYRLRWANSCLCATTIWAFLLNWAFDMGLLARDVSRLDFSAEWICQVSKHTCEFELHCFAFSCAALRLELRVVCWGPSTVRLALALALARADSNMGLDSVCWASSCPGPTYFPSLIFFFIWLVLVLGETKH